MLQELMMCELHLVVKRSNRVFLNVQWIIQKTSTHVFLQSVLIFPQIPVTCRTCGLQPPGGNDYKT